MKYNKAMPYRRCQFYPCVYVLIHVKEQGIMFYFHMKLVDLPVYNRSDKVVGSS